MRDSTIGENDLNLKITIWDYLIDLELFFIFVIAVLLMITSGFKLIFFYYYYSVLLKKKNLFEFIYFELITLNQGGYQIELQVVKWPLLKTQYCWILN